MEAKKGKSIEISQDIFSRLSIKSLMRFKCISKLCDVIILDPYFADIHQSRSISRPDHRTKLFIRCQGNFYTIDSNLRQPKACILPPLEKLDGLNYPKFEYAKGVFCLWSSCNHTAVICNPSTGEVRFLPHLSKVGEDLRTYLCYCSIGFDPNKRRHKILMTLYDTANKSTRLWVFTLCQDESWRAIKRMPYFKPLMTEGVYIDEAVYFFGAFANSSRIKIVEFNVRTEEIRTISLWYDKEIRTDIELYFNLVEIEGKLAAIDSRSNGIQIWILRSPETEEWIDWLAIIFKKNQVVSEKTYSVSRFCCSTLDKEEIAVINSRDKPSNRILLYDVKNDRWGAIEIMGLAEKDKILGIYGYEDCVYSLG